ncbi:energy transducer TonB [Frateuria sp. Soil773]|uniref:energy transducer TonB n=1 Tax=Frateuria sp. Soil773 TaxID=1736407 RepID=UPI0006FD26CC|nr:energy transducer TonB [Frateuria sp. Soil773]KRE97632.1 energy transducer TonB [Frateuria sp. Soil773]
MKIIMLCAAALALAAAMSARAAETREETYVIGADVDPQGHVGAVQFDDGVPAAFTGLLTSAVKQWHFMPAILDGRPVPAHTFIYAKLRATPDAKGHYRLLVSFIGNGPKLISNFGLKYPADAEHAREAALLMLDASVQPDGRLAVMQVRSKFEEWPVRPSFKTAVLVAAKHWHGIPEQVDGKPMATQVRIPVNFYLNQADFTAKQISLLREAARQEAMTESESGIPLPSNQEVALDSPLKPDAVLTVSSAL